MVLDTHGEAFTVTKFFESDAFVIEKLTEFCWAEWHGADAVVKDQEQFVTCKLLVLCD